LKEQNEGVLVFTLKAIAASPSVTPIAVRIQYRNDAVAKMVFKVLPTTSMKLIFFTYARKTRKGMRILSFRFNGRIITPEETAGSLGLQDGW
jgi:hypothetical protein